MIVLLDTVGLLALWDESDQWHRIAQASFAKLLESRADLVTTTAILLECVNAAARRPYRSAVSRLRNEMEKGNRLIAPISDDWRTAWFNYENGGSDSAGIVDNISFAVMRRLKISKAFTNDRHFRAAGFEVLF